MIIFIIVIIGLSLLILGHEAGHFFAAKSFGLKVDEFGFGFPPRIKAWKRGETEYSLNWLPFGGFVKLAGERGEFEMVDGDGAPNAGEDHSRHLYTQPAWKKSVIMLAGVFMNFILGWLLISATLMVGAPKALVITDIQPGSPAAAVGLMSGDVVKGYTGSQSFIDFVNAHRGATTTVTIIRSDKEMSFEVTPRVTTAPNEGAIGVALAEAGTDRESVPRALWDGLVSSVMLVGYTFAAFYELVRQLFTHATLLAGVVGPVGIVGVAEETGKIGLTYLLQFIGIVSINLTVVNLIPFPALDGGRFLLAIIEKIKGSPLSYKVEAWINGLGFAFLILLMVLLTVRDIGALL